MKHILTLMALMILLPAISMSQTYIYRNGKEKVIRTYSITSDNTVTIKNKLGNTRVYQKAEIDSIVYRNPAYKMFAESDEKCYKWFLAIDGAGCRKAGYGDMRASFGYQANKNFYFGGGFGARIGSYNDEIQWQKYPTRHYTYTENGELARIYGWEQDCCDNGILFGFPVFVNARINFLKDKKIMPVADFRAGMVITSEIQPETGLQCGIRYSKGQKGRSLSLTAGFNTVYIGTHNHTDYKAATFFNIRLAREF